MVMQDQEHRQKLKKTGFFFKYNANGRGKIDTTSDKAFAADIPNRDDMDESFKASTIYVD